MKKIEVFDGNSLSSQVVFYQTENPRCAFLGEGNNIPIDADLLSKHMLFLGGIGTGKTNALNQIIAQTKMNMTENDVMVIFDTKGDFYKKFYKQGDIVISNDNTACGVDGEDYWNLFNEIETDEHMEENIIEISKALFSEKIEKTNQPFFPNAAKDIFSAIVTHFMRRPEVKKDNDMLRWVLDTIPPEGLRKLMSCHEDFEAMESYIRDNNSGQTMGVLAELQQVSREIFLGNFKKEGTLSMRDLVRKKGGKTIFIEYDLGIGKMLSPIYTLLFDLAIKEALCRKKSEGNVYFIVDEFSLLPRLQHIEDAVNFGRSLGVKFIIGIQNVDQIYESYGEHRARSLLSGFSTTICFRVNDEKSKQFIKDLHGKNRKKEIYMASIQGRGLVENVRDASVVEDWDIVRLGVGEAIIGFPSKPPFIFKFKKTS